MESERAKCTLRPSGAAGRRKSDLPQSDGPPDLWCMKTSWGFRWQGMKNVRQEIPSESAQWIISACFAQVTLGQSIMLSLLKIDDVCMKPSAIMANIWNQLFSNHSLRVNHKFNALTINHHLIMQQFGHLINPICFIHHSNSVPLFQMEISHSSCWI